MLISLRRSSMSFGTRSTAGVCEHASQWRFSSYRATVGLADPPPWLNVEALHELFGGASEFARLGSTDGHPSRCQTRIREALLSPRMTPSTSSRLRSISSCERASRFRRSSGSVFDGRTLKCQSFAVDRDAVEMRDLALGGVALLQLLQLQRDVRDRRVQLAGDEVPRPERREDLRELAALLEIELEHQQERDDARVGLREVAEVVVRRRPRRRTPRAPCACGA